PLINNWVGSRRLKKAMEMGSTDAIIEFSYHTKDGSKEMKQEAINWLRKAAKNGNTEAQHRLGELIEDKEEQLFWTQKAAAKNYGDSLFALGYIYENGIGVEKDLNQSAFYYCILVRHSGARDACYQVGQQLTAEERQAVSD